MDGSEFTQRIGTCDMSRVSVRLRHWCQSPVNDRYKNARARVTSRLLSFITARYSKLSAQLLGVN